MSTRLILDDERNIKDDPIVKLPKHWYKDTLLLVRSDSEFMDIWEKYIYRDLDLIGISFDNDLGENSIEGKYILSHIIRMYLSKHPEKLNKLEFHIHTANIEARKSMEALLSSMYKVLRYN